jgi:acetylornithine deacetylase/succinyl-diaminopimelate desuccinylase-like protein
MRSGPDGYGSPAVITFGPGDFEQAHAVDEHIAIAEVAEAAEIFCGALQSLLAA